MVITDAEIKVGDVVIDHTLHESPKVWRSAIYNKIVWPIERIANGAIYWRDNSIVCYIGSNMLFRVQRAEAKVSDRWNGKCRCGLGTYTGFNSVEHEGGKCEKL